MAWNIPCRLVSFLLHIERCLLVHHLVHILRRLKTIGMVLYRWVLLMMPWRRLEGPISVMQLAFRTASVLAAFGRRLTMKEGRKEKSLRHGAC